MKSQKFELQDALLLLGVIALVGGVAAWSRPAAAVLFGIMCFAAVWLIEVNKSRGQEKGRVR